MALDGSEGTLHAGAAQIEIESPDELVARLWAVSAGDWMLLGIDAQLLGSGGAQALALWRWIEDQTSGHT